MKIASFLGIKPSYVGVDLGTYAIKVAEVQAGNPPLITAIGQVRLPRGTVLGGIYKDLDVISDRLKTLLKNLKIKNKKAIIAISSYGAIIKRINIKLQEDKDLETLIYEEAEAHIPFDLEDVYLDYQIMNEESDILDVLVVATKKEIINNVAEIIEKAGLLPVSIEIDVTSLSNIVEYLYEKEEPYIIIDLGASKTSVILCKEKNILANRDIGYGLLEINDYLQDKLNISFEETEKLKISGGEKDREIYLEAVRWYIKEITEKVQDTIKYYESVFENCQIKTIYISGGGSCINDINTYLKNFLGITTYNVNSLTKIEAKKIDEKSLEYYSKIANTAISLASREFL